MYNCVGVCMCVPMVFLLKWGWRRASLLLILYGVECCERGNIQVLSPILPSQFTEWISKLRNNLKIFETLDEPKTTDEKREDKKNENERIEYNLKNDG